MLEILGCCCMSVYMVGKTLDLLMQLKQGQYGRLRLALPLSERTCQNILQGV